MSTFPSHLFPYWALLLCNTETETFPHVCCLFWHHFFVFRWFFRLGFRLRPRGASAARRNSNNLRPLCCKDTFLITSWSHRPLFCVCVCALLCSRMREQKLKLQVQACWPSQDKLKAHLSWYVLFQFILFCSFSTAEGFGAAWFMILKWTRNCEIYMMKICESKIMTIWVKAVPCGPVTDIKTQHYLWYSNKSIRADSCAV